MNAPLRDLEVRLILQAIAALGASGSRRSLWIVIGALVGLVMIALEAAGHYAPYAVGTLPPFALALDWIGVALAVPIVLRWLDTDIDVPLRAADRLWFSLAGRAHELPSWAKRVRRWRAACAMFAGGVGIVGLVALAVPDEPKTIATLAAFVAAPIVAMIVVALSPLRTTAASAPEIVDAPQAQPASIQAARRTDDRATIPPGDVAYGWLAMRIDGRGRSDLVRAAVFGGIAGFAAPPIVSRIGLQTAWLVMLGAVLGGCAQIAVRSSRSPSAIATSWYRLGGGGVGAVYWTLAAEQSVAAVGLTSALNIGNAMLGQPSLSVPLALIGIAVVASVAATARAIDAMWPATTDRRGAASLLRVLVAWLVVASLLVATGLAGHEAGALVAAAIAVAVAIITCVVCCTVTASARAPAAVRRTSH